MGRRISEPPGKTKNNSSTNNGRNNNNWGLLTSNHFVKKLFEDNLLQDSRNSPQPTASNQQTTVPGNKKYDAAVRSYISDITVNPLGGTQMPKVGMFTPKASAAGLRNKELQ